jgi:phage terminase small subunit
MTPRQKRFVEEYLVDLNATQALIRAGYSAHSAGHNAYALLKRPEVKAGVSRGRARLARSSKVSAERVIQEYAALAFSDLRQLVDWGPDGVVPKAAGEISDDAARALAEVSDTRSRAGNGTVKVKLHDKKGALDALARHLGLFVERHEVTGKDGAALPPLKVVILGTLPSSETG